MKKIILLTSLFTSSVFANGVDFSLNQSSIPDALQLYYTQVLNKPFMISPDVVKDDRKITFHLTPDLDGRSFLINYLSMLGLSVVNKNGVDFYYVKPAAKDVKPAQFSFIYKPLYRSSSYLSSVLSSLVDTGKFSSDNSKADTLVFFGTKAEINRIELALPKIDTKGDEVYVGGYVYQVQTTSHDGNGLQLAMNLLKSKLSLQVGGSSPSSSDQNFLKISSGSLSAFVEIFNNDSRFHVVSSPSLRVTSGSDASFSVGDDVPTLGNVNYTGDQSIQSVVYRSSGVIFKVSPVVKKEIIDLNVSQELSNFTNTENGVNNSPTLIKRSISTSVGLKSGDIVLIGGLASSQQTDTDTGFSFLPSFFHTKGKNKDKTDIVIMLQAKNVSN